MESGLYSLFAICYSPSDFLPVDFLEELARGAERVDGGGGAGVAADLDEDLGDLLLSDAVAQRAAQVRAQLVRPVEDRDHREVEHAARLARQAFAAPHGAPAIFVEDVLQWLVEIVHILHRGIDILVAEHGPAHAEPLVMHRLVHGGVSSWVMARGALVGKRSLPDRTTRCHLGNSSPSCPGLSRASTSLQRFGKQDVDGRDKPGHEDHLACEFLPDPLAVLAQCRYRAILARLAGALCGRSRI